MSSISTFANLENESKIELLLSEGELIDGYKDGDCMVYAYLLNDFFVSLYVNELTDESIMQVSTSPECIENYVNNLELADLY